MEFIEYGKNQFKWPSRDDICTYDFDQILCLVQPPEPINQRYFGLQEKDFKEACTAQNT